MRLSSLLVSIFLLQLSAYSAIWEVGTGFPYTLPSQVSGLVNDGDTVHITAGTYPSDVTNWTANDLLIQGINGMAHMESNGNAWGGKAIWVIQGNNTTVEYIEFSECSVIDMNGAGIRQEGANLTVRHCYFHDNEDGILTGAVSPSTVRIEYCEFAYNGYGNGYSHNIYVGHVDSLIFRYNYTHHTHVGHELKSRAYVNIIEYNRFSNEQNGTASREIDLPDGGQAYIIGNVLHQGQQGQNSNMIGFGAESLNNPGPHELYAINNTLVNERTVGSFFSVPSGVFFKAYNNILAGDGNFISGGVLPTGADTLANVQRSVFAVFAFADPNNYNYRIQPGSAAETGGFPAGYSNSGYALVAWDEYVHPTNKVVRCQHATLDVGAHEVCSTSLAEIDHDALHLWPVPGSGQLQYSIGSLKSIDRIEVHNMQGQIILKQNGDPNKGMIDLSDYPSGTYFIQFRMKDGTVQQQQVVTH